MASFKLDQALAAQQALRDSLGMEEELFPVEAFVGMISDEIEASRDAGRHDQTIVDMVQKVTGQTITLDDIAHFYAQPDERRG